MINENKRQTFRHEILIQKFVGNYLQNPIVPERLDLIDDILRTLHPLSSGDQTIFICSVEEWIGRHVKFGTDQSHFLSLRVSNEKSGKSKQ